MRFDNKTNKFSLLESVKVAFFDMDGLIFDTENLFYILYNQIAAEDKVPGFGKDLFVRCTGLTFARSSELVLLEMGKDYPYEKLYKKTLEAISLKAQKGLPIKAGITALLDCFYKNSIRCFVVSSTKTQIAREWIESAGLSKYFEEVIGGDTVLKSKPDSEIYLYALDKANSLASSCIVLEDSVNGAMSAISAGLRVVLIPDFYKPETALQEKCWKVVRSASELIKNEYCF